jgi:glycosyltransferase involved in cell wall biosynthesis
MSGSIAVSAAKGLTAAAASPRTFGGGLRAMSVAIYLHDLSGGGVERQSLIIADEFRRHGVDVTLVVHQLRGQLLDQVPAGLRVIDLGSSRTLHDVPRLAGFLRREEPDILVANVDLNNVAALLAKGIAFSRTKIVICQHNPISAAYLRSESWVYRYVGTSYRLLAPLIDCAVAVSFGVAEELVDLAAVPRERVLTINNPVVGPDFQDRCDEDIRHPWFNQPNRPVFVTAGRMVAQKDHDGMLHALAIHRRTMDSRLIILGTGPLRDHLRRVTERLGLTDAVDFAGFHPNTLPFFRQADAFLLSSRAEGFGNVLVEAMGCGTPVIATLCEHGPKEILEHGRYGALVEPGDPEALAGAMNGVTTLRERFPADLLRQRANEFSYAACASRYMALFKSLAPNRAWVA